MTTEVSLSSKEPHGECSSSPDSRSTMASKSLVYQRKIPGKPNLYGFVRETHICVWNNVCGDKICSDCQ